MNLNSLTIDKAISIIMMIFLFIRLENSPKLRLNSIFYYHISDPKINFLVITSLQLVIEILKQLFYVFSSLSLLKIQNLRIVFLIKPRIILTYNKITSCSFTNSSFCLCSQSLLYLSYPFWIVSGFIFSV